MTFTLDGELHLRDVPESLRRKLMDRMTIPNPDYIRALYMRFPAFGIPRDLMLFRVAQNELILPRGMAVEVWRQRPVNTQRIDRMTDLPKLDWPEGSITLRDYQQQVMDTILADPIPQGVVVMPCGAGKTETALCLIREIGQPALWITHTLDLVDQAVERAAERLGLQGEQIGIIAGGKRGIGTHLTVATVQSLYKMDLDELAGKVGTVIVDECQHVVVSPHSAEMFNAVLACLPARHRYGLTATPARADGLEETIHMVLGDTICRTDRDKLLAVGATVLPSVRMVPTKFTYTPSAREADRIDPMRLRASIAGNAERRSLIYSYLDADLTLGHTCLILASSLLLLEALRDDLRQWVLPGQLTVDPCYINGGTRKEDRAAAIKAVRQGKSRCLLATYQLAKEGLDIPCADRLYLVQPIRDASTVEQAVGRIMRPAQGKEDAVVYDFVDVAVPTCKYQYAARKRVYKKLNLTIKEENSQ